MKHTIIAAGMSLAAGAALADVPVLHVYTYDSFMADWGPGPQVERAFEETCGCDLQFIGAGDGAALLARLQLEGTRSAADIVLGLDTNLMHSARETGLFVPHGITPSNLTLPIDWQDPEFLPFDWGYFAFVHHTDLANPPRSFEDLAASDLRILIQDPRSSTPGLGLVYWIEAAYGAEAAGIWEGLSDNIVTVTPGWSEAYGLFLEGEADMVLSYSTSPAYHLIAEEDDSKTAAAFAEGHYMQIEIAGITAASDQPALAKAFLEFMLSPAFQSAIPTGNWMYPAALPSSTLPAGFDGLIVPETVLHFSAEEAADRRDAAIETWQTALSR